MSITPVGPAQRTAAKSMLASFCLRAQRTKFPASVRWLASALASHSTRSPSRAAARVRW
ncbi:MAG: hypothetical protein ACLP52_20470 [Streptosporangiaceae bacterium]